MIELIQSKKIGKKNYNFVFKGENLHEVIMESQKLSFGDVHKCGVCGKENLILQARVAGEKKYKYTEIKCLECRAQLVFGKTQEDENTYFIRKKEDKTYDWQAYNPD